MNLMAFAYTVLAIVSAVTGVVRGGRWLAKNEPDYTLSRMWPIATIAGVLAGSAAALSVVLNAFAWMAILCFVHYGAAVAVTDLKSGRMPHRFNDRATLTVLPLVVASYWGETWIIPEVLMAIAIALFFPIAWFFGYLGGGDFRFSFSSVAIAFLGGATGVAVFFLALGLCSLPFLKRGVKSVRIGPAFPTAALIGALAGPFVLTFMSGGVAV